MKKFYKLISTWSVTLIHYKNICNLHNTRLHGLYFITTFRNYNYYSYISKTGNIYFMIELYDNLDSAKHTYDWIMKANRKNGIKVLDDLGIALHGASPATAPHALAAAPVAR